MRRENYYLDSEEIFMAQREKVRKQIYFSSASNIEEVDDEKKNLKQDDLNQQLKNISYVSDWQIA